MQLFLTVEVMQLSRGQFLQALLMGLFGIAMGILIFLFLFKISQKYSFFPIWTKWTARIFGLFMASFSFVWTVILILVYSGIIRSTQ